MSRVSMLLVCALAACGPAPLRPDCYDPGAYVVDGHQLTVGGSSIYLDGLPVHTARARLNGIWALAVDEIFAVGDDGIILRSNSGGTLWSEYVSPTRRPLVAVRGYGAAKYAVGPGAAIRQTTGGWHQLGPAADFICFAAEPDAPIAIDSFGNWHLLDAPVTR